MKNVLLTGILLSTLLLNCKSKNTAEANNENTTTNQNISPNASKMKGDWTITQVLHDKSISVKPFNEGVKSKCFEGSTWKLVPNNYTGNYTLNGADDCPNITQKISFQVTKTGEFMFKKIVEGTKMKENTVGYSLRVENQTETSFNLVQNIPFEGKIEQIVYKFEKITK